MKPTADVAHSSDGLVLGRRPRLLLPCVLLALARVIPPDLVRASAGLLARGARRCSRVAPCCFYFCCFARELQAGGPSLAARRLRVEGRPGPRHLARRRQQQLY